MDILSFRNRKVQERGDTKHAQRTDLCFDLSMRCILTIAVIEAINDLHLIPQYESYIVPTEFSRHGTRLTT